MPPKSRKVKKAGRITVEPAGISVTYVKCPKCPKLRPDETMLLINPNEPCCRMCKGIEWGNEYRRTHPVKKRAKAKRKVETVA
jgi:hypothetical protein